MGVSTSPAQSVVAAPHQVGGSMTLPASFTLQGAGAPSSCFGSLKNHSTKALSLAISLTKSSSFTQHSQSVLRAKDTILMLLYGLEMFLGVCGMSSNSSNLQLAGVRRIYRPPSLVAVAPTVS